MSPERAQLCAAVRTARAAVREASVALEAYDQAHAPFGVGDDIRGTEGYGKTKRDVVGRVIWVSFDADGRIGSVRVKLYKQDGTLGQLVRHWYYYNRETPEVIRRVPDPS